MPSITPIRKLRFLNSALGLILGGRHHEVSVQVRHAQIYWQVALVSFEFQNIEENAKMKESLCQAQIKIKDLPKIDRSIYVSEYRNVYK